MANECCTCDDCVEYLYNRDAQFREWARWDAQEEEDDPEYFVSIDEDARLDLAIWENFIEHNYGESFVDELRAADAA